MSELSFASQVDQAFDLKSGGDLVPVGGQQAVVEIAASSGMITAQKVAVPRNDQAILAKIRVMAAAAGTAWYYSWPTKNRDGTTGRVEGATIKCANAIARLYGNCAVDCQVKDEGTHLLFYARFLDLETGYQLTRPFRQRKNQNTGMKDQDRAEDIILQIGASKAIRNVINNALEFHVSYAQDIAKQALVEQVGKDLGKWVEWLQRQYEDARLPIERVVRVVGKPVGEWVARDVTRLAAEWNAVLDGMTHVNDLYPVAEEAAATSATDKMSAAAETAKRTRTRAKTEEAATTQTDKQETAAESKADPAEAIAKAGQEASQASQVSTNEESGSLDLEAATADHGASDEEENPFKD